MADVYDSDANAIRGHMLGLAAWRELRVRLHQSEPRAGDEREQRWAKEGVPYAWIKTERLDTVREGG